jgi:hypothetical protein
VILGIYHQQLAGLEVYMAAMIERESHFLMFAVPVVDEQALKWLTGEK